MAMRFESKVWEHVFEPAKGKPYLHLEKANDKGICHCKCERALVAVPDQMDCPWCGCGWLFSCAQCGKAFTYAKSVLIHTPIEKIVEFDLTGRGYEKDMDSIHDASQLMTEMMSDLEPEKEYVYLDGYFLPLDAEDFSLEGLYANHTIAELPHAVELKSAGALEAAFADGEYWADRQIEDPEE